MTRSNTGGNTGGNTSSTAGGGPAAAAPREVQAVLLDVDGTLIDSNDAHARAWVDACREFGYDGVTFAQVRPLIGMGGDKVLPRLTGLAEDTPEGKRLTKRRAELFTERYLPGVRPFPGVRELVRRMRDDGFTVVVASSAERAELGKLLEVAGVAELNQRSTSSSDAEESKPDPDIIEAALERARCPAEAAILLGDTPYDVEAALRAGVRVIAVRCGGWDDDALRGAAAIYDDPADLLAHYDNSPLGGGATKG